MLGDREMSDADFILPLHAELVRKKNVGFHYSAEADFICGKAELYLELAPPGGS